MLDFTGAVVVVVGDKVFVGEVTVEVGGASVVPVVGAESVVFGAVVAVGGASVVEVEVVVGALKVVVGAMVVVFVGDVVADGAVSVVLGARVVEVDNDFTCANAFEDKRITTPPTYSRFMSSPLG